MRMNSYVHNHSNEESRLFPMVNSFCCRRISRAKLAGLIILVGLLLVIVAIAGPRYELNRKDGIRPKAASYVYTGDSVVNKEIHSNDVPAHKKKDFRQRLPQCLIIGVKKAGTGAMVQYLKMHPDIVIADRELNFFDYEDNFNLGFEYYRSLMPPSYEGQITMEKTSNYFHNKNTEWRVHSMNSSIKMILLVREPISRAVSDYLQRQLKEKKIKGVIPAFEDLILRPKSGRINEGYPGIRPSFYYKHMVRWLKYFPLSQFHIVDGDSLVKNPYQEVYAVETFLGLPHLIGKDRFVFSDKKGFYCMSLDSENGTRREQCLSRGKGRKHPEVDPGVIEMLTDLFNPLNEQFYQLIGRRFSW